MSDSTLEERLADLLAPEQLRLRMTLRLLCEGRGGVLLDDDSEHWQSANSLVELDFAVQYDDVHLDTGFMATADGRIARDRLIDAYPEIEATPETLDEYILGIVRSWTKCGRRSELQPAPEEELVSYVTRRSEDTADDVRAAIRRLLDSGKLRPRTREAHEQDGD